MHYDLAITLKEDLDELASHIAITSKRLEEILIERRKRVEKEEIRESILGIDGSYNSATLLGNERLYAITATSVKEDFSVESHIGGDFVYTDTPGSDLVASITMSLFEALLAIDGILKGYKYIFTDGSFRSLFSVYTGQISGIPSRIALLVKQAISEIGLHPLEEALFYISEEFGVSPKRDFYNLLKGFSQEASSLLYKYISIDKRRRGIRIDLENIKREIRESSIYRLLVNSVLSKAKEVLRISSDASEIRELEDALDRRQYEIEPLANALALYSLYVRILEKLVEKLRESESIIIGASKRVVRETIEIEDIRIIEPRNKKLIGRIIASSEAFETPGYLKLKVKELTRLSIEKASLIADKVKKVDRYLSLKDPSISGGALLLKASEGSILRIEYMHSPELKVSDEEIASKTSSLIFYKRGLSGGTATIVYVESAHNKCSVDSKFILDLSEKLHDKIRKRLGE